MLEKMGNPEKKLKFVHIAGTNGKGSTAAMTASILRKAGYRTGLYTSPMDGVKTALELAGSDGVVLCFGSLYSIGSIRDALISLQGELA